MFHPSDIIIETFIDHLLGRYARLFPGSDDYSRALSDVARASLTQIARSNAPYHDLDHTIIVTQVGEAIIAGKRVRGGGVGPSDWTHFISSLLCFAVGFSRGCLPQDKDSRVVIDAEGNCFDIPRGSTDGCLWPYYTDRSKLYVIHRFSNHPSIDAEILANTIEYGRYPPVPERHTDLASYPGLLRAAHIIGTAADPGFKLKLRRLLIEIQESGIYNDEAFQDTARFRAEYPRIFWETFHPLIPEGVELLQYTAEGRFWLAQLHAHVHIEEHSERASSAKA